MHVYKLPSGRWRVIVKHKGKQASGSADTKPAANVLGAQLLLDIGARQTAHTTTVGDLLDGHLSSVEWSPSTLLDAKRVTAQLPDVFRSRLVDEVDGAVLTGLYRQLTRDGWSPHRIRRAHFVISTAWADAIAWGWADRNPARIARLPKAPRREVRPPTLDEIRAVLDATTEPFTTFLRLAAVSGARRGELVALQWPDLDLERGAMAITRSLVQGDHIIVQGDTKTSRKGHRVNALDPVTTAALAAIRRRQDDMADGFSPLWVFSHTAGATPWRPDYPSRAFRHACQRAGVSGVRLHDLRHYVATTMLYDGEHPQDVAAQLGHASTRTTLEVYAHHLPGRGRESVERRAARLGG